MMKPSITNGKRKNKLTFFIREKYFSIFRLKIYNISPINKKEKIKQKANVINKLAIKVKPKAITFSFFEL